MKVGDKVRVKAHPILPREIIGLIGTITRFERYNNIEEYYVNLDKDPREQGVERYFGDNKDQIKEYLEIYIPSKLEKSMA